MNILDTLHSGKVKGWVEQLRGRDPLPPLAPAEEWDPALTRKINDTSHEEICAGIAKLDDDMALCVKSGLLLWNDALEPSHVLSQQVKTETGSYWHGIMHRREPDFGNSKYWFRRVGSHPAFEAVATHATSLLQRRGDGYSQTWLSEIQINGWDPFGFVDRCEQAAGKREAPEIVELLEQVQVAEIEALLGWTAAKVEH
jgi:hypothetical protein